MSFSYFSLNRSFKVYKCFDEALHITHFNGLVINFKSSNEELNVKKNIYSLKLVCISYVPVCNSFRKIKWHFFEEDGYPCSVSNSSIHSLSS